MAAETKPSIVFAHGLWADGSCFSKLIPTLQAEGHEVIVSQHGLDSLKGDVALIKANKRFDLILLPGQRHGYGDMTEYFFWRMADYFSRYLIGDQSGRPVDIEEMDREQPQTGEKEGGGRTPEEEDEDDYQ